MGRCKRSKGPRGQGSSQGRVFIMPFWARNFTITAFLSTSEHQWVLRNCWRNLIKKKKKTRKANPRILASRLREARGNNTPNRLATQLLRMTSIYSNFSLQSHPWIKHEGHENRENDHQVKKLLIFEQTLLVNT